MLLHDLPDNNDNNNNDNNNDKDLKLLPPLGAAVRQFSF